jgi:DNA-binding response OmpR family regulator
MEHTFNRRPTVMLVEDNPLITEFVQAHLEHSNIDAIIAEGCTEARELLGTHTPDLMVLDIVLDDGLGYDLCRFIRAGGERGELAHLVDVPVLMLTARADESDRIEGFAAGADDYVTKPFNPQELVYRIQAILRRSLGTSNALIELGPLRIDPRRREVLLNTQLLELTPKEFELLHLLANHHGTVFSREDLLQRVWGYSYYGNTRTVDVHVNRLRQKLAVGDTQLSITTEWGVGYRLVLPVPSDDRPPARTEREQLAVSRVS